jgi:hypothetical protein
LSVKTLKSVLAAGAVLAAAAVPARAYDIE